MKPLIFYIDDEPRNLTVFEASLPDDWEIRTFENAMSALEAMSKAEPWVILTDQRMPGVTGVQCLEVARKMCPNSVRIIVTGFSDEDLVVESVRKAQVFDYIRKPWDPDELEASLQRAIEFYKANTERQKLISELKAQEIQLRDKNFELLKMTTELGAAIQRETEIRSELECWVPPFVLWALNDPSIKFPLRKDIVGITFDIIKSSLIHGVTVGNKSVRSIVIQAFSEAIIRHGGWRESHSGDSAYGHFGLLNDQIRPHEAAMAVAREFRSALRSISEVNNVSLECGIALHVAKESVVDVHTVLMNTPRGTVTQKSFDTTASDIDLLHRMEKLVHKLPGSNIILSEDFVKELRVLPVNLKELGYCLFDGQNQSVKLYLIPSDLLKGEQIHAFIATHFTREPVSNPKAA